LAKPGLKGFYFTSLYSGQNHLQQLELRGIRNLTDEGLSCIQSSHLTSVDLSECVNVDKQAVVNLLHR
jgi:hypothetical protein